MKIKLHKIFVSQASLPAIRVELCGRVPTGVTLTTRTNGRFDAVLHHTVP
jgi:hypothetical protein